VRDDPAVTVDSTPTAPESQRITRRPQFRVGAVVAVALLIAFVVWLLVRGSGSSTPARAPARAGAVPVTPAVLAALARSTSAPIYWVGPRSDSTYELTKTADDRVFIRYLPPGVPVGTVQAYLTVGTYPVAHAFSVTGTLARRHGAVRVPIPGGGVGFYESSSPTNIYLAFPNESYQVELYDPSAAQARSLAVSGLVAPVSTSGAVSSTVATATTQAQLQSLSASLGHPIYWAGHRAGTTFELTRAPGGHVFVRYLPAGAAVGTDHPYLTIGTYPVKDAFALTKKLSTDSSSVRVPVAKGGVAFYNRLRPTNVYVAYPGTDIQVEVYDPAPGAALQLVSSQRIVPVG
jgi:hypothetical protein